MQEKEIKRFQEDVGSKTDFVHVDKRNHTKGQRFLMRRNSIFPSQANKKFGFLQKEWRKERRRRSFF
jgi:hypothetical protein